MVSGHSDNFISNEDTIAAVAFEASINCKLPLALIFPFNGCFPPSKLTQTVTELQSNCGGKWHTLQEAHKALNPFTAAN